MMIGTRIRVADRDCFYFGRIATIEDIAEFPRVTVYTVSLPSETGNGRISFALKARDALPLHA